MLNGRDVSSELRVPEVSEAASRVAADPGVREALVAKQRELMSTGDWVAEETPLGLGYGSLVLVVVLLGVWFVSNQYGKMTKPWYWLTIVAARTAGTTLGDLLASRRGLGLGLWVSTICTSLLLAGIVILWRDRRATRLREA